MPLLEFFDHYGSLLQTGAIVVSAIAAVCLIVHNGKLSRRRALIDLILQQKNNETLVKDIQLVFSLANESDNTPGCRPISKGH